MKNQNCDRDDFQIYRDYVKHEDNLINNRMMWLVLSQSFFFISFALALGAFVNATDEAAEKVGLFLQIISVLGIAVGVATSAAVLAALNSIDGLRSRWDLLKTDDNRYLPDLTGGGKIFAAIFGFFLPIVIPLIFATTWTYILFVVI